MMKRRSCYLLVGIFLILSCVICGATKVSRYRDKKSPNNSDSCETSPVRRNVTLRGGIKAGYFHKLAQYVAMELCVQLCCQEKGCDVAFMIDKNCYGVKCFSEELCHVVPATNAPRALMISKVDFRGEVYLERFKPERLKCFQTSVEHNITLTGGLHAGNFTAVGHVENIDACAKLCCVRERCDLALMVNNHCFLVRCLNNEKCRSTTVINQQFRTHIVRVNRTKVIAQEQPAVRGLSSSPGKTSKLMCKNGIVQYNQTLLGGYDAGRFKLLSHSTNMSTCIRLCCGEMTCDVALMVEKKCYGVACSTMRLCQTIPAKSSVMLNNLSPMISFITSRNEEVNSVILRRQSEICRSNVISYDVTLRGGKHAGKYKAFGPVDDMSECIRICCMQKYCDLAFMINGTCFTVRCHTEESCQEVRSPASVFKPMISYVVREKPRDNNKKKEKSHRKRLMQKHQRKGIHRSPKNNTSKDLPHIPSPNLPSVDGEHYCTNSEIMYNVTLRGGITSGKFRDRGVLPSMQECLRVCCIAKSCDLAFMLSHHCFSVTCKNQNLCEVVTARTSGYRPQIAYIYARSNFTNHESSRSQGRNKSTESKNVTESGRSEKSSSNKVVHSQGSDDSHEHLEPKKAENGKVGLVTPSKHQKKLHKTKKLLRKRKKNHKRKHHESDREKLKHLYAEERLLLRKLSLLKLRMEMIRRKNHENNTNVKDKVLIEAFEDEPKISKFSSDKDSRSKIENVGESGNENPTTVSNYRKNVPSLLKHTKDSTKTSSKRTKNDSSISKNGSKFGLKEEESDSEKGDRKRKLSEEKLPQNHTSSKNATISSQSFVLNDRTSDLKNRSANVEKVKTIPHLTTLELLKFRNLSSLNIFGATRGSMQAYFQEQDGMNNATKQTEMYFHNGKRTKEFRGNNDIKNNEKNAASLEKMISETTELKYGDPEKVLIKNARKSRKKKPEVRLGHRIGNTSPLDVNDKRFVNTSRTDTISSPPGEESSETTFSRSENFLDGTELTQRVQDNPGHSTESKKHLIRFHESSFKRDDDDDQKQLNHVVSLMNSSRTQRNEANGN